MSFVIRPGHAHPLGATFDGRGVNFAVFSQNARLVELCLFGELDVETRLAMRSGAAHVWHAYVEGLKPGQRYGFRAHGPYAPTRGHRFNPHKLLVDPYARALGGKVDYHAPVFGFAPAQPDGDLLDVRDDAWGVPKSVVVDDAFDWGSDRAPRVPWPDMVLYEMHVRGFTRRHPEVPSEIRGTYGGVASEAAIAHLKSIGVTTVELMPVHECADEAAVMARGMKNYWGYSTLGYFAPEQRYAAQPGHQVAEFKQMVKALHAASIEVVLDVVYNHTCEGDRFGPTLCFRGLDNAAYYRLNPQDLRVYADYSGCGNSLDVGSPQTLKLIMDSLRYWVTEMHVDGFRFDLASALARDAHHVDKLSAFFDIIHQDPTLSRVKLIAEPWDLGDGGYQLGNFPVLWSEWNGRYRDTVRRFWRGHGDRTRVGDLGYRLTGSSDLYQGDGRHPHASINFVTAHDGFTLRDLVSYETKHNEANGERNRDGWNDNASCNFGVEGDTSDPAILAMRARQQRNFLATLFVSQGVPMISSGDEIGKTQLGNNNAYVQDNPVGWLDWELGEREKAILAFVRELSALRRAHPVFRRRRFLGGARTKTSALKDVTWLRAGGGEMRPEDWSDPSRPALALLLAGDALGWEDDLDDPADVERDDAFLVALNAGDEAIPIQLPDEAAEAASRWEVVLSTAPEWQKGAAPSRVRPGETLTVEGHTVLVVRGTR